MAMNVEAKKISKADTREKIIQAAKELFSRKGYHKTSVLDIVRSVDMSAGSVYVHFKNKEDLFEEIATRDVEDLRILRQVEQIGVALHLARVITEPLTAEVLLGEAPALKQHTP